MINYNKNKEFKKIKRLNEKELREEFIRLKKIERTELILELIIGTMWFLGISVVLLFFTEKVYPKFIALAPIGLNIFILIKNLKWIKKINDEIKLNK